ncbi:MAG: NHLP bacteriocin system secretion protein [Chlorobiaceae bacterium]|jgi:HlyD family secretion protein|nr:NHLP bacteriocin system secretion protein [Chlorobiaceae bacterium]
MAIEFRKEALKKLSSPDDLDRLIPVTDRRGWIALLSAAIFILAMTAWVIWGKIDTTVEGQGITMGAETVQSISSRSAGTVTDFNLKDGQTVQEGEILAIIEQPELKHEFLSAFSAYEFQLSHQAEKRSFLKRQIALLELKAARVDEQPGKPTMNKRTRASTEQSVMELKNSLYKLDNDLADAERNLEKSRENYKWRSTVISPVTGMVTEIKVTNGQPVSPGIELLQVEPFINNKSGDIKLDLYIASGNAKKIRKGMEAYIAPSIVKPEEYGYIVGKVLYISEYPVSVQSIAAEIRNEELARKFVLSSPPYKVTVKLLRDRSNSSGFRWTSGRDPRTTISSGILCSGKIVVEEQSPIELIIPMMKNILFPDFM